MAMSTGINISESRLIEENGRAHFMTKRFDRIGNNQKLHMQTLCAIAHFDYNSSGEYSYEQAFGVMRELKLSYSDITEMYRRMVFNIVARNQDDHTKNISFLMGPDGEWHLAPAYDLLYSCNLSTGWTNKHQMSINGKRDNFTKEDLIIIGDNAGIKNGVKIITEVTDTVSKWKVFAKSAKVAKEKTNIIQKQLRLF
jgi:serine/threonine-protein kinase HipA